MNKAVLTQNPTLNKFRMVLVIVDMVGDCAFVQALRASPSVPLRETGDGVT